MVLVQGNALAAETSSARVPMLTAQPFRPGELPESVLVELEVDAAAYAERRAAEAGIPTELWLRLGVEAVRVVDTIAEAALARTSDIVTTLDHAAAAPEAVAPLETRRQRAYAHHLRAATPVSRVPAHRRRFSLALPDQLLAGWSIGAVAAAATISDYVSGLALRVPPHVVAWEVAAAERGQPLAEWIYAETLRALRPQRAKRSSSRTGSAEDSGELPDSRPGRRRAFPP